MPRRRPFSYPSPRRTAAVVEFGGVHEECVPALVHLLRLNAVEPTVYLNRRIKEHRPGLRARFPDISDRVRFVALDGRPARRRFFRRLNREAPDLLVVNTFQFDGHTFSEELWSGPALGVVHNAKIIESQPVARAMVADGRIALLTLAPHVTGHLLAADHVTYRSTASITSTFPSPPKARPVRSGRRTIALPGSVNYSARDYGKVLDALPPIIDRVGADGIEISVVGGGGFRQGDGPTGRDRLEQEAAARGLADVFSFADLNDEGFVPGKEYYARLRGADFLLPTVVPHDPSFRTVKITSAIPTSLGLGVPAILDRWTAAVYGLPAVVYRDPDVGAGLTAALTMSDDELTDLRTRLGRHRERELERACSEMAWALASVGLGDG